VSVNRTPVENWEKGQAVQDWIEGLYERAKERLREESDNASNAPTGGADK